MEIVGLKKFVQDDINKLITKFVGVKPHPLTIELRYLISKFNFRYKNSNVAFCEYMFVEVLHCCSCQQLIKGEMLRVYNELCEECESELP